MPSSHRHAALALLAISACATITADEMQPISITTNDDNGKLVDKAHCVLKNDKGVWEMDAPGFVSVHRSSRDLLVECKKEGFPDGQARAISRASGGMFGNIVFGGGIGAIIDHAQGTGYNYPNTVTVKLGQSVVVDRKDEQAKEMAQGEPAAAQ